MSIQTGLYFNRNKNTINVGFDTKEKGLKILKGKVVDQNGEAVIGASIQVKVLLPESLPILTVTMN